MILFFGWKVFGVYPAVWHSYQGTDCCLGWLSEHFPIDGRFDAVCQDFHGNILIFPAAR